MIEGKENRDVDFKESHSGLKNEDLVAFANAQGGSILIGVREARDDTGMQHGEVIGWEGDFDRTRNSIQTKAANCRPPINLDVEREYDGEHHIIRIDIAESKNKPCCTGGGIYKKREDGKNKAITPSEMTVLILEKEAMEFITRLQDAGAKFVEELMKGQEMLAKMIGNVESIAERAESAASSAASSAEEAASAASEAVDAVHDRDY
jgi:predicted HTH transcriptional regulator